MKAILRHFGADARDEVLGSVGLAPHEWRTAEAHWQREIDGQLARGESDGVEAFEVVLLETRSLLRDKKPKVQGLRDHGLALDRQPAPQPAPPAAPVLVIPHAPSPAPNELDTTAPMGLRLSLDEPDPLPFSGSAAPPVSAVDESPASQDSGETVLAMSAIDVDDPLPFSPASLNLEQYASLQAELRVHPDNTAQILDRYSLSDPLQRHNIDQHYQQHFQSDPELAARYEQLLSEYIVYLSRK